MKPPAASQSGRLEYLDLLRGLFILVMVEGHTMRALLHPAIQAGTLYRAHELPHNLTGPAFLFISGVAFAYSSLSRWGVYRRWGPALRARLFRWGLVLATGVCLQLTYASLRRSLEESTPSQWTYLFSVNILQCIVLGLIMLQILVLFTPDLRRFFLGAVIATFVIALVSPFAWKFSGSGPVWLASLISGRTASIFPIFPYLGFTFAGAAWGYLHGMARRKGGGRNAAGPEAGELTEGAFLRASVWFSGLLIVAGSVFALLPTPEIYSDFWNTSPQFLAIRIGILIFVAVSARILESRFERGTRGFLSMVGRQSLLIYVAHLVILYGSAFNPDTNLVKSLGNTLSPASAIATLIVFFAVLVAMSGAWEWWKRGPRWRAKGLQLTLASYLAYIFLAG